MLKQDVYAFTSACAKIPSNVLRDKAKTTSITSSPKGGRERGRETFYENNILSANLAEQQNPSEF